MVLLWFVYNGKHGKSVFCFKKNNLGSRKKYKLKAVATQVWVPTHRLKTSGLMVKFIHDALCIIHQYMHG